jgi:hypothetical protein
MIEMQTDHSGYAKREGKNYELLISRFHTECLLQLVRIWEANHSVANLLAKVDSAHWKGLIKILKAKQKGGGKTKWICYRETNECSDELHICQLICAQSKLSCVWLKTIPESNWNWKTRTSIL